MKHLIALLLFSSVCLGTKYSEDDVRKFGVQIESGGLNWLAPKTDEQIWKMVDRATQMLNDQGFVKEAESIRNDYLAFYSGYVTKMMNDRHQGDHGPFIAFLDRVWVVVFDKLCGNDWEIAKKLHLSDIYSLNMTIVPTFRPCSFNLNGMAESERKGEYKRHFAKDDDSRQLYGLVPIVTYWVVDGGCMAAGGGILCGVAANLAERFMGNVLAPVLSDKIFTRSCGG